ncbi:MAG: hypothetical protein ABIJ09_06130 [Pseudomonadota bacterium]
MSRKKRRSATVSSSPPHEGGDSLSGTGLPDLVAGPEVSQAVSGDPHPLPPKLDGKEAPVRGLVESWPSLVVREATLVVAALALLTFLALLFDAPLADLATPAQPDNPEKAPWYFVGMQEMVSYSATSGVLLFPGALLVALLLLPMLERRGSRTGRWFADSGGVSFGLALLLGLASSSLGLLAWEQDLTRPGVLDPALLTVLTGLVASGAVGLLQRRWHAALSVLMGVLLAAYLVFTVVGVLCRGPSWQFFWPWQPWTGGAG